MVTPRSEKPEKRRRKKKQPKKFRLSYSFLLLITMIIVGSVTGFITFSFGKQALEGVNPSPSGSKLLKINPNNQEKPKPSPDKDPSNKNSFFLNESELVAEAKAKTQLELGSITRTSLQPRANVSDRKKIYTRVDRAFNSMRDPLAVSASADQKIAEKIAALRQRVYINARSSGRNVDTSSSVKPTVIPAPVAEANFSSQWQDREIPVSNDQVKVEIIETALP